MHVHTDDPGRALSLATAMGAVALVEVSDMHGQIVDRTARLAPVIEHRATDVVIVLRATATARSPRASARAASSSAARP